MTETASRRSESMRSGSLRRYASSPLLVYAVAVILLLLIALRLPGILTLNGMLSLLVLGSVLGIAAIGQTLAVIIGGIDISIPAVIGMAVVLLAYFYANGWPFWQILIIVL